jgi:large subunit ribosomal protein L22
MALKYRAKHRYVRMSPRKIRLFADLIRGRFAEEAMELLRFVPNRGARLLRKVVRSAVDNARDLEAEQLDDLRVLESRVDGGPILKRSIPRARGMAYPIKKRMSHIVIGLGYGDERDLAPETEDTGAEE